MNNKGSGIFRISWKYLQFFFRSGYWHGHGIHSPFVYDLVRNVIFNHNRYEPPGLAIEYHNNLMKDGTVMRISDPGAGSRVSSKSARKLSSMAKYSSITYKQGQLLYRLTRWFQPECVLELGTGLGISTMYLAQGAHPQGVISVEGSYEKHAYAAKQMAETGLENVKFVHADFKDIFSELLPGEGMRFLAFIDGDHRYLSTVERVERILSDEKIKDVILILDDIYWSKGMEQAWHVCCANKKVQISLDLFRFGILIKRPGIAKQHFSIKF